MSCSGKTYLYLPTPGTGCIAKGTGLLGPPPRWWPWCGWGLEALARNLGDSSEAAGSAEDAIWAFWLLLAGLSSPRRRRG